MPWIAAILPFITAASAGVGIGEGIDALVSKPGAPSTPTTPTSLPTPATPTAPSQPQVQVAQNAGSNLIAQTGGGLSPNALTQLIGLLDTSGSGVGSGAQQASNNIYGTPG
jgi:hypothetical protein